MTQDPPVNRGVRFPADKLSGITINQDEVGIGHDADDDGYEEGWYDNGNDRIWSARLNTEQLNDGPIIVHYVIFDRAGNATYYESDYTVFIKNHPPSITSVTLGTDIAGNGNIGGTRFYNTNYFTNPAFVARNQRLAFEVHKTGGAGTVYYRITHVTRTSINAIDIQAGEIYTINTTGSTEWVSIGASSDAPGTTFVATGAIGGTGTAFKYAQSGDDQFVLKESGFPTGDVSTSDRALYSDFTGMPDGTAYFLVKIWDTTTTGLESEQLFDMVVVRLKIENDDTTPPASRLYDLSPYARDLDTDVTTTLNNAQPTAIGKNMNRGGLYRDGSGATAAISGHVEPRGNAAGSVNSFLEKDGSGAYVLPNIAKDKVSGKVILRGYVSDNQRISAIQLQFGSAQAITIIGTDANQTAISGSAGHFRVLTPESGAWVYDDLSLDEHRVEWAYVWDTQTTSPVVGEITVRAIARDAKVGDYAAIPYALAPNDSAQVDQAAGTAEPPAANNASYNTIKVDTVPYISGITTSLSGALRSNPSTFDRSALGRYPVRLGETITIKGFNFGTSPTVTLGGTTVGGGSSAMNTITRPISGTSLVSGALVVTANSIGSNNNANSNTAPYHQEANNMNNNTLTDDRYLYVWDTGALIDKADLTNPFLRMDSASNWYASYGQGAMEFYLNKNGTAAMFESNFNKYHNTTVAFDSDGNYYGGATNTDRISNTEATSYTFFNRGREVTAPATGAIMTGERTGAAWNWCITAEQEYTTLTGLKYPALPLPEQPIRPRCT